MEKSSIIKVMVVEDEAIVLTDLQVQLGKLGYYVIGTAMHSEEAIKMAHDLKPDIILMDIRLKGKVDGITAAHRIQAKDNIPIIYVTAYADQHTLQRAIRTKPYGYILKPISDTDLKTSIEIGIYKHRLDQRLKESEKKFRMIFENANDIIALVDNHGLIIDINKRVKDILGFSPSRLIGRDFDELGILPESQLKPLVEKLQNPTARKAVNKITELEVKNKHGRPIYLESSSVSLQLSKEIQGFLAIIRDISARKKAEELLRLEQMRSKTIARRIIELQEKERLLLASEIHDRYLQGLAAILYFIQMLDIKKLGQETQKKKNQLTKMIKSSIERGRTLISDIEPLREPDIGLVQIIKKMINNKQYNRKTQFYFKYPKNIPPLDLIVRSNIATIIQEP